MYMLSTGEPPRSKKLAKLQHLPRCNETEAALATYASIANS